MSESGEDPNVHEMHSLDEWPENTKSYIAARTGATHARFFLDYLQSGMDLLDCGCGEGTITVDLAAHVTPGQVTGIDIGANVLDKARELAVRRGLTNVRFETVSVYELPFPDGSFDAVFSHALFEHLTDKALALREIRRVLRPRGIVGLRAPDLGALIIEPQDALIDQFWDLFRRIRTEMGGVSNAGRQLVGLLRQASFSNVRGSASFNSFGTPEQIQWFAAAFSQFTLNSLYANEWLKRGWVDRATLQQISDRWKTWAQQPDAFAAEPWGEAIGFADSA